MSLEEEVAAALGDRSTQAWPAVVAVDATAQAWARQGAPDGAVVVAGYQAAARGRGGRPWEVDFERDVVFSMVVRPALPAEQEGRLFTVAALAVTDVAGGRIRWPDAVEEPGGGRLGAVNVYAELGSDGVDWAVLTVLLVAPVEPAAAAAATVAAIDERRRQEPEQLRRDHVDRCTTLGRQVEARMIPLGPAGPVVSGEAVDLAADGALVVRTARGSRVAVRPQNLGLLEDAVTRDRG